MRDALNALPEPQERALEVAFGLMAGRAPDRFVVGLAVLGLLAEVAHKEPLVCLIDDAQWLDEASCNVLAFVGRRLLAESVLLILAVRESGDDRLLADLPELTLEGLDEEDARSLLDDVVTGPLDAQVRDRIVAETHGNPLGLLELPRGMTQAELRGGFGVPTTSPISGHIEQHYRRRVAALAAPVRQLMLVAAADPTADATLVRRAADALGLRSDVATDTDLFEIGSHVLFRHPLVRSAAYAEATPEDRSAAHLALAAATDSERDPERRVWHRAVAARGLDEDVASEVERSAAIAQSRAGVSAAAAFLDRAAALTPDPGSRADRELAAAHAYLQAGEFEAARRLLAAGAASAADDLQRARVEQLNGQIEAAARPGREAPARLFHAATKLEPLDMRRARETYLQAWWAAILAGPFAAPGQLVEISRAARAIPQPAHPRPCDLLLEGLATLTTQGRSAAQPELRRAIDLFVSDRVSDDDWIQWGRSATTAAFGLWDFERWLGLSARQVNRARESGALSSLVLSLNLHAFGRAYCGDMDEAARVVAEQNAARVATGIRMASYGARLLAAYQGRPANMSPGLATLDDELTTTGDGYVLQVAAFTTAVLNNGLSLYADAMAEAQEMTAQFDFMAPLTLSERIEAAVRGGHPDVADDALQKLAESTVAGSDWAAGMWARGRALVSRGEEAERGYRESIACLERTPLRPELGRSHLLYGEWLRRENRRIDARAELRTAHTAFVTMGAEGFAERARRELAATGEHVRKRVEDTRTDLTPQEDYVARLARLGRSNAEIAAELFLSVRTVEWHLRQVFTKLGITSRRQLKDVFPTHNG
jgi:DNA-binding CsgD family transcriptional regulator